MTETPIQKPLTKALHTTRVVERIAAHLIATDEHTMGMAYYSAPELLGRVLNVLGNQTPDDSILYDACLTAVGRVIDHFRAQTAQAVVDATTHQHRYGQYGFRCLDCGEQVPQ